MIGKIDCAFIGPFVGIRNNGCKVLLAKPFQKKKTEITCVFKSGSMEQEVVSRTPSDTLFGLREFNVPPDFPFDCEVAYYFKEDGKVIENLDSLVRGDLVFKNIRPSKIKNVSVLSCNNPFASKSKKVSRFNMWNQLNLKASSASIELVVLAGDQLYNDNLETVLKKREVDKEALTRRFIKNYLIYFGVPARKKLMASTPSIAIWDDHDITDGYGSRPEQFKEKNKEKWDLFFQVAKECFEKLQASRNPENQFSMSFTNFLDIANTRIYLLDMRSHRNILKKQLFHKVDLIELEKSLDSLPDRITNVSLVSPVVVARSTKDFDMRTRVFGKSLYYLRAGLLKTIGRVGQMDVVIRKAFGKLMLTDLCDDLDDSLGSSKNISEFKKLVNLILPKLKDGISFQFLTGDIHTGGRSDLYISDGKDRFKVPVIVSSPIGYEPMAKIVERLTTARKTIELIEGEDLVVTQENGEYTSQRNFVFLNYEDGELLRTHYFEFKELPEQEVISLSAPKVHDQVVVTEQILEI